MTSTTYTLLQQENISGRIPGLTVVDSGDKTKIREIAETILKKHSEDSVVLHVRNNDTLAQNNYPAFP